MEQVFGVQVGEARSTPAATVASERNFQVFVQLFFKKLAAGCASRLFDDLPPVTPGDALEC